MYYETAPKEGNALGVVTYQNKGSKRYAQYKSSSLKKLGKGESVLVSLIVESPAKVNVGIHLRDWLGRTRDFFVDKKGKKETVSGEEKGGSDGLETSQ